MGDAAALGAAKEVDMKIHVGASGYGYKEWKGIFYPDKIPPKEMLRFYAERLGAVEINNTFYRMPSERVLASWAEQVPDAFVFAFKAPQVITHFKRLKNVGSETAYLLRTLAVLGERLGRSSSSFPRASPRTLGRLGAFSRSFRGHHVLRLRVPERHVAR